MKQNKVCQRRVGPGPAQVHFGANSSGFRKFDPSKFVIPLDQDVLVGDPQGSVWDQEAWVDKQPQVGCFRQASTALS